MFVEGLLFVFKTALALLKIHSEKITSLKCFETLLKYIQEEIPRSSVHNIQEVIETALSMPVTEEQLNVFAREFRDMQESASSPTRKEQKRDPVATADPQVNSQLAELQSALEESQRRCRDLESQLAAATQQVNHAKAAMQSMSVENKVLEDQMKALQEENRRLREAQRNNEQKTTDEPPVSTSSRSASIAEIEVATATEAQSSVASSDADATSTA